MNRTSLPRFGWWLAVAVWASTIIWLSSLSGDEIDRLDLWDVWDKATHFVAFAVGVILLCFALRVSVSWPWRRVGFTAAAIISLFGATDEWHQRFTPKRNGGDVKDWIADTLGAITGAYLASSLYARNQRKNHPTPARD